MIQLSHNQLKLHMVLQLEFLRLIDPLQLKLLMNKMMKVISLHLGMFSNIARSGGTLIRAGHTEAIVDIAKICGLNPSGVICEIMKDNGEMARLPDLKSFKKTDISGTIEDLISYRRRTKIY